MTEHYVRPPLFAREARPAWIAVWRFRLFALIVLALAVLAAVLLFREFTGATSQDPGIGALAPLAATAPGAWSLLR